MACIITVVGATGTQGGSVVQALLKDTKYHIRGLTRNAQSPKAHALSQQGAFEGSHAIFAVTNFFEAFPSVGKEEAIEIEVRLGTNLAKAALATSTLEHYIRSTFPNCNEVSGGTHSIAHYTGKNQIDAYIRSTSLIQKTTFLWIPSYAQNIHYPWYTPFALPGDDKTLYQLQANSPTSKWSLAGDVNTNVGLFVAAVFAQPEKTLPSKIVLAAVDDMAAEEVVAALAKREGKAGKVLQISEEQYCAIWPQWGELMNASHVYWERFGEQAFSAGDEVVLGKDDLGVDGLVGTAKYFAGL